MTTHQPTTSQRETLEAERLQVCHELTALHEALKAELDPDMDEAASELNERNTMMALVREKTRNLREIDHALQQIQQGTYGLCEQCGRAIDPARLEAMPETTFCIDCKLALEKRTRIAFSRAA